MYVAVFLARRFGLRPVRPSQTAAALHDIGPGASFPYDGGDDPSFFSAGYHGAAVTWGVCRPDVRTAIRRGDWVVFFSSERDGREVTHYRFVGALTVERKIPHTAIFTNRPNTRYRDYLNLLIRPKGSGWEHYEPALHHDDWHDDSWMWRMSERRGQHREDLKTAGAHHTAGAPLTLHGQPAPIAESYVIFARSPCWIARHPPLVATHRTGERRERWTPRWLPLRALLFRRSGRGLRIANQQRAHRHFRRSLDDPNWPRTLWRTVAACIRSQRWAVQCARVVGRGTGAVATRRGGSCSRPSGADSGGGGRVAP